MSQAEFSKENGIHFTTLNSWLWRDEEWRKNAHEKKRRVDKTSCGHAKKSKPVFHEPVHVHMTAGSGITIKLPSGIEVGFNNVQQAQASICWIRELAGC